MIKCIDIVADYAREKSILIAIETHGSVEEKSVNEHRHFHSVSKT